MSANPDFPAFDTPVPDGGYRWWYADATDPSGALHVVVIAFVGSVFSPFYAAANRRGRGDPMDYCALNVALYRPEGKRWVMTEFERAAIERSAGRFRLGRSALTWNGHELTIDIDDRTAPLRQHVRGRIVVRPQVRQPRAFALATGERHTWWPLAPVTDVTVDFDAPDWHWRGSGYADANFGTEPLGEGFAGWHWSRRHAGDKTTITYCTEPRDGEPLRLDLTIDSRGRVTERDAPEAQSLPLPFWRVPRPIVADDVVTSIATLEDTPFYVRSAVTLANSDSPVMHESLSLDRFGSAWVQRLIPFRMRPFWRGPAS